MCQAQNARRCERRERAAVEDASQRQDRQAAVKKRIKSTPHRKGSDRTGHSGKTHQYRVSATTIQDYGGKLVKRQIVSGIYRCRVVVAETPKNKLIEVTLKELTNRI